MKKRQRMKNQAKKLNQLQLELENEVEQLAAKCQATNEYVDFANQQAEVTTKHFMDLREAASTHQQGIYDMVGQQAIEHSRRISNIVTIIGKSQADGLAKIDKTQRENKFIELSLVEISKQLTITRNVVIVLTVVNVLLLAGQVILI